MPSGVPAPSAAVRRDGQRASLSLSLGGSDAGQAEPPPFPGAAPPAQPHRSPLFPPARGQLRPQAPPPSSSGAPQSHISSGRHSRSPPGSQATRRAPIHTGSLTAPRGSAAGGPHPASRALGSRSRGPGVSVTWAMAARAPHLASMAQPRGAEGGPGNASPRAARSLRSLRRPLQQPASQSASGSAALFPPPPRLSPSAAPRPQRPRAARRQTRPGSRGEPQLGLPPYSSACLVTTISPCHPRHSDDCCHLAD